MPNRVYSLVDMHLWEFKQQLAQHPGHALLFVFDDGETIPPDFHVTEVGHVAKNFVDCGGTRRRSEVCMLQVWVAANDKDHRLAPSKLASILDLAREVVPDESLEVEVEYEGCVISQYRVVGAETLDGALRFKLEDKHTDCLAKEACGLESSCCAPGTSTGSKCC